MTTFAPPTTPPVRFARDSARISRVPYLPGLDGIRALAVVAVMVYHANSSWLPGGFLGVEMFFVISGYLITLLIIAERERTYRVSLVEFWKRRARRLLPALFVMMLLVVVYTVFFEPSAVGQLRGDVLAGIGYSSNWYQLFVGLGYTAAFDFAPLRHLWSLAVEEQFYVLWPIVMVVLLGRRGTRKIADVSRWLIVAAVAIAITTALLYHPGVIGEPDVTPEAYWHIGGRAISKLDVLYIGTVARLPGILLGAAFAMLWRPFAIARGPLRDKGRVFDLLAIAALVALAWMCWNIHLVAPNGVADARLFRGGLFMVSVFTIVVIAAVSHPGAWSNRILGNPLFVWVGLRSYGLYLYHWPIYQAIRKLAGNQLTAAQFIVAIVITAMVTELSYRCVERPIRQGTFGPLVGRPRNARSATARRVLVAGGVVVSGVAMFAAATLAVARLEPSEITEALDRNGEATTNLADSDAVIPQSDASTTTTSTSTTTTSTTTTSVTPTTDPGLVAVDAPATGDLLADRVALPRAAESPSSTDDPDGGDAAPSEPPGSDESVPPVGSERLSLGVVSSLDGLDPLTVPPAGQLPSLRLIGFGDSVMRGSAEELRARGFVVDAEQSRQFIAALPQLEAIRDNGFLGSAVVVHLGTNGSFSAESLDQMMATLADVPIVVFVTGKADRVWISGNNALLRAMPERYANVTVIDWEVLGPLCPGDCFYSDDIHLNAAGQTYYADLVTQILGL